MNSKTIILLFFIALQQVSYAVTFKLENDVLQERKAEYLLDLPRSSRELLLYGYCRPYKVVSDMLLVFSYFLYGNTSQYSNQKLPKDLSGKDLRCFDFTGCQFTYTNLMDANLKNVILTNTICDYRAVFKQNIINQELKSDESYLSFVAQDLTSITKYYPSFDNHGKASLLSIACGLSRLPLYRRADFYIKLEYWSCKLFILKQNTNKLGEKLSCSFLQTLSSDIELFCWSTTYPQDKTTINRQIAKVTLK